MRFFNTLPPTLSSITLLVAASLMSQAVVAQDNVPICNPIARVIEGTGQNFQEGEIICSGASLQDANNAQILCFINNAIITLDDPLEVITEQTCAQQAATDTRPCEDGSTAQCFVPKGPEDDFVIAEPDVAISPARPSFSWEAVESAESYTIRLIGSDINWERSVEGTQLEYPAEEPSLQPGAYRLIVSANGPDEIIGIATRVINLPPIAGSFRVAPDASNTVRQIDTHP